jgi:hypothetical protein
LRLGFRLSKRGRSFVVTDPVGELAINSKPTMSLAEIEVRIGDFIRQGGKRR